MARAWADGGASGKGLCLPPVPEGRASQAARPESPSTLGQGSSPGVGPIPCYSTFLEPGSGPIKSPSLLAAPEARSGCKVVSEFACVLKCLFCKAKGGDSSRASGPNGSPAFPATPLLVHLWKGVVRARRCGPGHCAEPASGCPTPRICHHLVMGKLLPKYVFTFVKIGTKS